MSIDTKGLRSVVRRFVGCATPVSTDIDPRGHRWSEAYLDELLPDAIAATEARADSAVPSSHHPSALSDRGSGECVQAPVRDTEKMAPVQGYIAGIPWSLHLEAYDAYCKKWSPQKAMIEGHCRGGFSVGELDMFIPGWRDRVSEIGRLKAEVASLRASLAAAEARADSAVPSSHVSDAYDGATTHPEFGNQAQAVAVGGAAASATTEPPSDNRREQFEKWARHSGITEKHRLLMWNAWCAALRALAQERAASAQSAREQPEGWKLVPLEPTPEMVKILFRMSSVFESGCVRAWKAILAQAPEPPLGAAAPLTSTASAPADSEPNLPKAEGESILREALARCVELFDKALPKFNWGASCLDAETIRLLNEVPSAARSALAGSK